MTDVACFCGCLYSFDGGRGACPQCGEDVTLTTGSMLNDARRRQEEQLAAENDGARRTGQAIRIPRQRTEAIPGLLAGIAASVTAREPGSGADSGRQRRTPLGDEAAR